LLFCFQCELPLLLRFDFGLPFLLGNTRALRTRCELAPCLGLLCNTPLLGLGGALFLRFSLSEPRLLRFSFDQSVLLGLCGPLPRILLHPGVLFRGLPLIYEPAAGDSCHGKHSRRQRAPPPALRRGFNRCRAPCASRLARRVFAGALGLRCLLRASCRSAGQGGPEALHHLLNVGLPPAVAQFESVPIREVFEPFGQLVCGRHMRALHENRRDRNIALQRSFDLEAHEIVGVVDAASSGGPDLEPLPADQRQHEIARFDFFAYDVAEIAPQRDRVHIHEHGILAERRHEITEKSTSLARGLLAPVVDENAAHECAPRATPHRLDAPCQAASLPLDMLMSRTCTYQL
jgi:hypothetical protein